MKDVEKADIRQSDHESGGDIPEDGDCEDGYVPEDTATGM